MAGTVNTNANGAVGALMSESIDGVEVCSRRWAWREALPGASKYETDLGV